MRIAHLVPGTCGVFYCENCLRDTDLAEAWRAAGHEPDLVPLYLPIRADGRAGETEGPIFLGGVNVHLQQKFALFRRTPRWLDRLLDSRRLLRWAAHRSAMTSAADLGGTLLAMLRGEAGPQAKEVRRLVAHLAERRPEVVLLSDALLAGLARPIRERAGAPVVCLLQDEDAFVDALPPPQRREAWALLRACAAEVAAFVAPSAYYRGLMAERLAVAPDRVAVVRYGIRPEGYGPAATPPDPPVLGFLGAVEPGKDLAALLEAFALLRRRPGLERLRLRAAGGAAPGGARVMEEVRRRVASGGFADAVEFLPNLPRGERQAFLRTLSVLAVPTNHPAAYGAYILEALASGVPVVVSRHGGAVELMEATGGGVLVEPGDPGAPGLADAVGALLADPDRARALGAAGRAAVLERFDVRRSAEELADVCRRAAERRIIYS